MASHLTSSDPQLLHPGWNSLSGHVLEGGFELQELIEGDEAHATLKVRVLGDRDLDCVAVFFPVDAASAAGQIEFWTLTRQLRHPNLSAPLGAGYLTLEGISAAYVVVRRADESLDGVLAERALTPSETGDALESVAKAVEALHLNGLAHGCLSPSRVLAVGDAIKLPTECVRALGVTPAVAVFTPAYLAPESSGENLSAESDLWCLGATVFEALTQKPWTEDLREETGALPEPFASIALRCLHEDPHGRANLAEVMALLRGELKPVPRVRAAVAGASTVLIVPEAAVASAPPLAPVEPAVEPVAFEPPPAVLSPAVLPPSPEPAPAVHEPPRPVLSPRPTFDEAIAAPARPPVRDRLASRDREQNEPGNHLWIWAGLTFLVVLGLIWFLRPKPAAEKPAATVASSTAKPASPAAATPPASPKTKAPSTNNAWETRTLQPDGSAPAATGTGDSVWRVVTFTYSHRGDAEKKAKLINAKHPNLHAEVFSPSGSASPFLVVLGGRMTKEEANQVRRRAIGSGLPHDSYIQNYTH